MAEAAYGVWIEPREETVAELEEQHGEWPAEWYRHDGDAWRTHSYAVAKLRADKVKSVCHWGQMYLRYTVRQFGSDGLPTPEEEGGIKMKLCAIEVDVAFLQRLMTAGEVMASRCIEGLPEEARFAYACTDASRRQLVLIFEHPDFPEVPPGEQISKMLVSFSTLSARELIEAALDEMGQSDGLPG